MQTVVLKAFTESADVKQQFARAHVDRIVQVATLIAKAFDNGNKVLLFGNGEAPRMPHTSPPNSSDAIGATGCLSRDRPRDGHRRDHVHCQ